MSFVDKKHRKKQKTQTEEKVRIIYEFSGTQSLEKKAL